MCKECPKDLSEAEGWTFGLGFGALSILIIMVALDIKFGWTRERAGGQLKTVVNAVQEMTVIILFPVKWPPMVKQLGKFFEVFSVDVQVLSPTCLGIPFDFYQRFMWSSSVALACALGPFLGGAITALVRAFFHRRCGCWPKSTVVGDGGQKKEKQGAKLTVFYNKHIVRNDGHLQEQLNKIPSLIAEYEGDYPKMWQVLEKKYVHDRSTFTTRFRAAWRAALPVVFIYSMAVILFVHPAVSGQSFYFFRCHEIKDMDTSDSLLTAGVAEARDPSYLVADYSLECYDDTWFKMLPYAIIVTGGFSFGIPLYLLIALCRHRKAIKELGRLAIIEEKAEKAAGEESVMSRLASVGAKFARKAGSRIRSLSTHRSSATGSVDEGKIPDTTEEAKTKNNASDSDTSESSDEFSGISEHDDPPAMIFIVPDDSEPGTVGAITVSAAANSGSFPEQKGDLSPRESEGGRCVPDGASRADEAKAQEFIDGLFDTLDRNGDGEVDVRECILAMRKNQGDAATKLGLLGFGSRVRQEDGSREAFESMFQAIDKDGSRTISRSELRAWAASVPELACDGIEGAGKPGTSGPKTGTTGPVAEDHERGNDGDETKSETKSETKFEVVTGGDGLAVIVPDSALAGAKRYDKAKEHTFAELLAVLYDIYIPECFWFDIVNFYFVRSFAFPAATNHSSRTIL